MDPLNVVFATLILNWWIKFLSIVPSLNQCGRWSFLVYKFQFQFNIQWSLSIQHSKIVILLQKTKMLLSGNRSLKLSGGKYGY